MTRYAKSLLFLSIVTLVTYLVLIVLGIRYLIVGDAGLMPFDLRFFGYTYFEATAYLAALPEASARFYTGPMRVIDTVFPALLGLWLGWALWGATRKIHAWSRVILMIVPASFILMDLAENALVGEMVDLGPTRIDDKLVALASSYTISKYVVLVVAFALLAVMIGATVNRNRRSGRS
ncbi:hypothetical protein [Shimia sp.]|uniref:hypothetical protein n=1 Tax=Shimia sp. TaxID=1954381 RepID=UPI003298A556